MYCAAQTFCAIAYILLTIIRWKAYSKLAPAIIFHLAIKYPIMKDLQVFEKCCGANSYMDYIDNNDIWWLWQMRPRNIREKDPPLVPEVCCKFLGKTTQRYHCQYEPTDENTLNGCGRELYEVLHFFDDSTVAFYINFMPVVFSAQALLASITAGVVIGLRRRKEKKKK